MPLTEKQENVEEEEDYNWFIIDFHGIVYYFDVCCTLVVYIYIYIYIYYIYCMFVSFLLVYFSLYIYHVKITISYNIQYIYFDKCVHSFNYYYSTKKKKRVSGTNDLDYYILYLYMIHLIGLKKIFHHCGYIKN